MTKDMVNWNLISWSQTISLAFLCAVSQAVSFANNVTLDIIPVNDHRNRSIPLTSPIRTLSSTTGRPKFESDDKSPMLLAAESKRRSRSRGDAALFADWGSVGLESSAGNRTMTLSGAPVSLPRRRTHSNTTTTAAIKTDANQRKLELEFPALQVAASSLSHDEGEEQASREDPAFGDGYNLGYKPSASESGAYSGWAPGPAHSYGGGGGGSSSYFGGSAPSYGQQDYSKSDYYQEKPSYQATNDGSDSGSYSGSSGGLDDNKTLLYALALKLRRTRERLAGQQGTDGSQLGMLLAGLPFLMSMSSGSSGGGGLGLGGLFGGGNNGGGLFGGFGR